MSGVEQTQREVHRWLSYGPPQGLVTSARVLQHKSVPVVLIRCAPLRESVITVLLGWLWKAVQI